MPPAFGRQNVVHHPQIHPKYATHLSCVSIILNPRVRGGAVNPKIVQNLVTIFFKNIFRKLVHIFEQLAHIFGELAHIFARKLVSRTSKQVSINLGPLWRLGVYNDTNSCTV